MPEMWGVPSRNHCCHRKTINMTYYVCVCVSVDLVIQNAMRVCRIILSSVACLSGPGFLKNISQTTRYSIMIIEMCVLIFSTILSEKFLILRRIKREFIKNVYWSFIWSNLYSCQILLKNWTSLTKFRKNFRIPNFMEIRPVGAELFHAEGQSDRQTDGTKLIVTFRSFANALKTTKNIQLLPGLFPWSKAVEI
jgi:hypothetical protein